jgi:GGDEF domain-containing protein
LRVNTGQEIQKQLARRYVMAQIAEILDKEARNTDTIVKQDKPDRFIILCPETQTSNTNTLIRRVVEKTRAQVGVQVGFGVAAFPEEAMTFEELLQKAEQKMIKPGAFSVGK